MSVKINGILVIDDSRNVSGIAIEASTACIIPTGNTASRTPAPQLSSIRINTQTNYPEYWDGSSWIEIVPYVTPPVSNNGRGVFAGGTPNSNSIQYITIQTTGNTTDFGDLNENKIYAGACASSTRGLFAGGQNPGTSNVIDYITIASTGDATDFGDLTLSRLGLAGCNSPTRGIFGGGGNPGSSDRIDYVTIATTGNATDFGDLTQARRFLSACSSPTRGVFAGGQSTGPSVDRNEIDYVTIASTGDAIDFGNLTQARAGIAACSSSTRGLFAGGSTHPGVDPDSGQNTIDYITFESTGASTDFGNLTASRTYLAACSSPGRGVFAGGQSQPNPNAATNIIDHVTIATTGNATDFGDLASSAYRLSGLSNSNGGV